VEYDELANLIFAKIKPLLEKNPGLAVFASERAKFEGWLKVELCGILSQHFRVYPEKYRVDLFFDDWAIELKTVNTNYRTEGIKNKSRPITKNVQSIVDDIDKLRRMDIQNKGVIFIAFPLSPENKEWAKLQKRITAQLTEIKPMPFSFKRGQAKGVLYFGLIE
jgi:hypothetical protein